MTLEGIHHAAYPENESPKPGWTRAEAVEGSATAKITANAQANVSIAKTFMIPSYEALEVSHLEKTPRLGGTIRVYAMIFDQYRSKAIAMGLALLLYP